MKSFFFTLFFLSFWTFVQAKDPIKVDPKVLTKENCQTHIQQQEQAKGIEAGLLEAIATIESKLNPLAVNAAGRPYYFRSVKDAVIFVKNSQRRGIRNISVGPMQLHVPSHRQHFKSLQDMFDPQQNIAHAAKMLKKLMGKYGSVEKAVRYYHSPTSAYNEPYKNRVFGAWAKVKKKQSKPAVKSKAKFNA